MFTRLGSFRTVAVQDALARPLRRIPRHPTESLAAPSRRIPVSGRNDVARRFLRGSELDVQEGLLLSHGDGSIHVGGFINGNRK